MLAAVAACGSKPGKVTAVVADKGTPVALVVEYAEPVSAASVTPEAYAVPGKEVAAVFVSDKEPFAKAEAGKPEKGPKPEGKKAPGPETKDGKYVVIVLKGECPEGPMDCCDKGPGCDRPEGEQCDSCKMAPKPEGPKPEGVEPGKGPKPEGPKPEGVEPGKGPKPEGPKPEDKPEVKEIPVPEIAVQQVADIKTAGGKALKAWKGAENASAAIPARMDRRGHHHGHHHGRPGDPMPGEKPASDSLATEGAE